MQRKIRVTTAFGIRHKHTQPSLGTVYEPQYNPFVTLGLSAVLFLLPHASSFECFKQKALHSETVRGRGTKSIVSAQKASCLSRNKHSGTKKNIADKEITSREALLGTDIHKPPPTSKTSREGKPNRRSQIRGRAESHTARWMVRLGND